MGGSYPNIHVIHPLTLSPLRMATHCMRGHQISDVLLGATTSDNQWTQNRQGNGYCLVHPVPWVAYQIPFPLDLCICFEWVGGVLTWTQWVS